MDFLNKDKEGVEFNFKNRGWRRVYRLATIYGWKPHGTFEPKSWEDDNPWDPSNYFSNDGQLVTEADALELADAIELAIMDLKPEDPENNPEKNFGNEWEAEMILRWNYCKYADLRDPAFLFFDDNWNKILTNFVIFCREGAFEIF